MSDIQKVEAEVKSDVAAKVAVIEALAKADAAKVENAFIAFVKAHKVVIIVGVLAFVLGLIV